MQAQQNDIFAGTINAMAAAMGRPVIFGPDNKPVKSANYRFQRTAAKNQGSMKSWIPRAIYSDSQESREREKIAARAIDLCNNDPNATGIVETFANTVIGTGLNPHPLLLDGGDLGLSADQIRTVKQQQIKNFTIWSYYADVQEKKWFSSILFLLQKCLIKYGEYVLLLHMLDDDTRPFSLACQVIHPLRLKTPTDLISKGKIKDGIEFDSYGRPKAYWIKKANAKSNASNNFTRITAKSGHRIKVIHYYDSDDPEQIRGISKLAPAMKYMRDFNDFLDAELVSNIVTAAFSLFIETVGDPYFPAANMATITETGYKSDNSTYDQRFQEMIPGQIMYGNANEKPHAIAAARPGATFDPFTRIIKKAIAQGVNVPFPVLYKDFDGMNYASYRSAMLEAWRVYSRHRNDMGQAVCQPINDMLQEEAWLRGMLDVDDFYSYGKALTAARWIGPPKGQIEPIKEIQADILAIQNNLKTRSQVILEQGGGSFNAVVEKLSEEQELLQENGLDENKIEKGVSDNE